MTVGGVGGRYRLGGLRKMRFWALFCVVSLSFWPLCSLASEWSGRFWTLLDAILVVAVRSGWILISVGAGPDGFDGFGRHLGRVGQF